VQQHSRQNSERGVSENKKPNTTSKAALIYKQKAPKSRPSSQGSQRMNRFQSQKQLLYQDNTIAKQYRLIPTPRQVGIRPPSRQ